PSSSRHSRSVRPERNSCATRQTTSGCSPARPMNSKSRRQISAKGSSFGVTGRPLHEKRVGGAIDEPILVAERQPEDFRRLQFRKLRLAESSDWCRKDLVDVVFLVSEQPHPFVEALDQPDFLGAVVFVLLAVRVS